MMFGTHVRIALASLRATRMRTALTTLGIVIGVSCISFVLSLGEGVRQSVNEQIGKSERDIINIRPGKVERSQGAITGYNFRALIGTSTLTEYDAESLAGLKNVRAVAPIMQITGSVKNGPEESKNAVIVASTADLPVVHRLDTQAGQFIEEDMANNVAVIGDDLAIELYGTSGSIGQQIILRGRPFTVIGVLEHQPSPANISTLDFNHAVIVGMDAGKSFNQGVAHIQQISLRVESPQKTGSAAAAVQSRLLKNHEGEEDFAVIRADEATKITDGLFNMLINVTGAIASISLIVGGVGIMNIMLVTVTERIHEIGIRKAVGATNGQILSQFLIEALVMSGAGGIIGIALSAVAGLVAGLALDFRPIMTPEIIVISFGVSVVVGALFGIFPAFKAARKDPIEALRQPN